MTLREPTAAFSEEPPDSSIPSVSRALSAGTWLDEFELGEVIAEGSASIVYAATDDTLAVPVAIAEYMPAQLAQRTDELQVTPQTPAHADVFAQGLSAFIDESRILARCDHPSLVRILRLREANATAYRVMPRYTASSLLDVRRGMNAPPDEDVLRALLDALLGALDAFHRAGGFHGKVTPSNILLLPNGRPLLLSPGGAGRAIAKDLATPPIMSSEPCFAPIEQLVESADMPLGASSDLYALAGVARYWISGQLPPPAFGAPGTAQRETLVDTAHRLRSRWPQLHYSACLLGALDSALSIYPAERPHSVAQMRVRIDSAPPAAFDHANRQTAVLSPGFAAGIDAALGIDAEPAMDAEINRHHAPKLMAPPGLNAAQEPDAGTERNSVLLLNGLTPPPSANPAAHSGPSNGAAQELDVELVVMDVPMASSDIAQVEGDALEPSVPAHRLRSPGRIAAWSGALVVLLALVAVGVYGLNQQHKLDRVLDVLGITGGAENVAPARTPTGRGVPASAAATTVPATSQAAAGGASPASMPSAPSSAGSLPSSAVPESAQVGPSTAAPENATTTESPTEPAAVAPPPGADRQAAPVTQSQATVHSPTSPREVCGVRTEFALYRCMQTQCSERQWTSHAECEHLRATDSVD